MTSEELFNMRAAMFRYGGSFIKSLAVTLGHADEINCRRLLHAFPGVIIKYGPDSFFYKALQDKKPIKIKKHFNGIKTSDQI